MELKKQNLTNYVPEQDGVHHNLSLFVFFGWKRSLSTTITSSPSYRLLHIFLLFFTFSLHLLHLIYI
ncbi:hypothetical protein L1887_08186 [Cichorium endivia]|nr:hypothetical protein L1887_08186 [Cichorium endivia]